MIIIEFVMIGWVLALAVIPFLEFCYWLVTGEIF